MTRLHDVSTPGDAAALTRCTRSTYPPAAFRQMRKPRTPAIELSRFSMFLRLAL
jgi:hypothetical protein